MPLLTVLSPRPHIQCLQIQMLFPPSKQGEIFHKHVWKVIDMWTSIQTNIARWASSKIILLNMKYFWYQFLTFPCFIWYFTLIIWQAEYDQIMQAPLVFGREALSTLLAPHICSCWTHEFEDLMLRSWDMTRDKWTFFLHLHFKSFQVTMCVCGMVSRARYPCVCDVFFILHLSIEH